MKFTANWLKQFVDTDLSARVIADRLSMLGLEVDSVEELFPHLENVVLARITDVKRHPDSDRLVVCRAEAGGEPVTVVCGAPNARPGLVSALALPGAVMPDGTKIKKSKIRGQLSEGMFCSGRDLGLGDDHGGILELSADMPVGQSLRQAMGLDDTVIEIDLTPNRPDCTSVIGVAREVAGFAGTSLSVPDAGVLPVLDGTRQPFDVVVEAPIDCPRYAARLLRGVTIAPSPEWLKNRLLAIGQRPINNVVDITNYVMLEYGQPLHAFDFDTLVGGRIVVRHARDGEVITTLDGQQRTLESDMLMICDAERPVAVAGVMGGENSEVSDETSTVLLESAYFNPISVRRTSRRLGLSTDASYRFERGIDPHLAPLALERAVSLIVDICGATVHPGGFDCCAALPAAQPITLRVQRAVDLLGIELTAPRIAELLNSIEIPTRIIDAATLEVQPPSFRVDIEREVDLIEEIARLSGYNEIPSTLPLVPLAYPQQAPERLLRKKLVDIMCGLGFHEAINYSFGSVEHYDKLLIPADHEARKVVQLLNPIADNQAVMRTMILPGLLENVCRNLNHQVSDLRLFEIGKVFHAGDQPQPRERQILTAVLSGRHHPNSALLHYGTSTVDMADLRGVIEQLADHLMLAQISCVESSVSQLYVDPGCALEIKAGETTLGICGRLDNKILKGFGIKQEVYFIELDLDVLVSLPQARRTFTMLPKFPAVRWDLAIVVPESVGSGHLLDHIRAMPLALVELVEIFDIYRGEPIAKGHKSIGITVQYRSAERTLDDITVGKVHQKIIDSVLSHFNGQLREGTQ